MRSINASFSSAPRPPALRRIRRASKRTAPSASGGSSSAPVRNATLTDTSGKSALGSTNNFGPV
jgi:hypothetical protein